MTRKSTIEILEAIKGSFVELIRAEIIEEVHDTLRGRMADDIQVSKEVLSTVSKLKNRVEELSNSLVPEDVEEGTRLTPIHPGVILKEEFIDHLPKDEKASLLNPSIPGKICSEKLLSVISGDSDITDSLAFGLGEYFLTSSEFWLNLQRRYDEEVKEI